MQKIDFIKIFAVRGGFYQGYPSFGLGIGSFLNYATYGVELGKYAGQIEERTHTISRFAILNYEIGPKVAAGLACGFSVVVYLCDVL